MRSANGDDKNGREGANQLSDTSNGQQGDYKNGSQWDSSSAGIESDPDYNMEFVISEAEASLAVKEEEENLEMPKQPAEGCSRNLEPRRHLRSRPTAVVEKLVRTQPLKRSRSQALETIFEEPLQKKGKVVLLSKAKAVRRLMIAGGETTSVRKKKQRKMKAKNLRESMTTRKRTRDEMER